jgi:UDP-3-O-[3-hydroxymyristoyl] N-acetylglucosamine deacetylase
MIYQRTLKAPISATGIGLHSGERVQLTLLPAEPNSGIRFQRMDLPNHPIIPCSPSLVNDTRLSSTLVTDDGVRVGTIEHIMSALAGLGIDNLIIQVTALEIPIMDGCSTTFIYLMQSVGIIEQIPHKKRFLRVKETVELTDGDKWVRFVPHEGFSVELSIHFDHPIFLQHPQHLRIDFANQSYLNEIARARTFGFMQEVEYMKSQGLGLGGSLNNAIVIDDEFVINPDGLRFPDEFVRHKILDAIGDLYILGYPLLTAFAGHKSGHAMNNQLLRKLLANPNAYEWVTFDNISDVPNSFHAIPKID